MIADLARWLTLALGVLLAAGTAAGFSRSPHWAVRMWDFPRAQIAAGALAAGAVYALFFHGGGGLEWGFVASQGAVFGWQMRKVLRYTPVVPVRVRRSRRSDAPRLRLLISNVKMENREHTRVLQAVRDSDPDVVLFVETDHRWAAALAPLGEQYPHGVRHPQDNWYGLMLFSRLPLHDTEVRFLVQDDIPSVHTLVELRPGEFVRLHGLHPRPPEPIRDQDSTPRDAELIVMANAIREAGPEHPTVVAGDLNDVAWSPTSELFLRLSGLLDPRVGRGLFNSFDAGNPIFRYPLDHVFHSNHFRLVELKRCPAVGSDHFPMLVELSLEPEAQAEQPRERPENGDHRVAEEKLEEQAEAAATGDDRPGRE